MGVGALPVGGGDDFYMLSEKPEYSLPFKVWGYFNLVGCTLIDNSDTYRHRPFVARRDSQRQGQGAQGNERTGCSPRTTAGLDSPQQRLQPVLTVDKQTS
jgi:hypothetical protein